MEGGTAERICNSAPSSPNYSGALLKSATRQREKKRVRLEEKEGSTSEGERGVTWGRALPHFVNSQFTSHSTLVLA